MKKGMAAVVAVTALLVPGIAGALAPNSVLPVYDVAVDCQRLLPTRETVDHVIPKAGSRIPLEVLVVVDRRDVTKAEASFKLASKSFERVGIDLNWRVRRKSIPNLGFETGPYLKWLKKGTGGMRPRGFDVVYLATSHRLYSNGQADCIGGIAYAQHAFAVGALEWYGVVGVRVDGFTEDLPQGPPLPDGGAKLVVHEIGHLLGGHHHFGSCGTPPEADDPSHPCDVMNPALVQQIGLHYGPVNAAIVRQHAQKYL